MSTKGGVFVSGLGGSGQRLSRPFVHLANDITAGSTLHRSDDIQSLQDKK